MKKSAVVGLTALALAGALTVVAGFGSAKNGKPFQNGNIPTWFDSWGKGDAKPVGNGDNSGDELLHVTEDKGISLMSARIAPEEYSEYGIEAQADTAYSIKATVNSDAVDKSVVGSIAFKNPSSAWASGKSISDYVVLNQTTEYGLDFTLTVKQAFGEPVVFACASLLDRNVKVTAQLDYLKELQSFTAILNPSLSSSAAGRVYVGDIQNTIQVNPVYGVGTVEGNISGYKTTFTTNNFFRTKLKAALNAGQSTSGFTPLEAITVANKDFVLPIYRLIIGGGNDGGARTIVNNFIKNYGCGDRGGSSSSSAGVSSIKYELTYSYDDYSKTLTYTDNTEYGFRNDNLTAIATITNITLDKTSIVVLPN